MNGFFSYCLANIKCYMLPLYSESPPNVDAVEQICNATFEVFNALASDASQAVENKKARQIWKYNILVRQYEKTETESIN